MKVGGETVSFRHEKRFENEPPVAVLVTDAQSNSEVNGRMARFKELRYNRVGLTLRPEIVAVKSESGDAAKFAALVGKIAKGSDAAIILMSRDSDVLAAGLKECADDRPLLYGADKDNLEAVAALAKEGGCAVGIKGDGVENLAELTEQLVAAGINDIVIDPGSRGTQAAFRDEIVIRNLALAKKFRPLGYPTITFPCEMTDDPLKEAMLASMLVAKYAGIVVLSDLQGETLFPLLVERMNIFTDPQRPLASEEGIYEIGDPGEDSPVLVTTNFSLTYFIVSGEIESSKVPAYLLIMDTEGLSVMTAWAAGKFVADLIGSFIKKCGIENKVKHRKLIIPGYAAAESGGIEEELPDWEIQVGPREAAHLPAFLKSWTP